MLSTLYSFHMSLWDRLVCKWCFSIIGPSLTLKCPSLEDKLSVVLIHRFKQLFSPPWNISSYFGSPNRIFFLKVSQIMSFLCSNWSISSPIQCNSDSWTPFNILYNSLVWYLSLNVWPSLLEWKDLCFFYWCVPYN